MDKRIWRATVVTCMFVGVGLPQPRHAEAASILDWLCGRSPQPTETVVACYPTTTCYDPCNACDPCNSCTPYVPCVPYVPCQPTVPTPAPRANTGQVAPLYLQPSAPRGITPSVQTMPAMPPVPVVPPPPAAAVVPSVPRINLIPETYYRTTWKQIPVTVYRPVVARDPVTGYPVTVMRACTTYEWQPNRVRRGFFSRLFFRLKPAPVPVAPVVAPNNCAPVMPNCPTAVMPNFGSPSVAAPVYASPTPTPAPYYGANPAPIQVPGPPPAAGTGTVLPPGSGLPPAGTTAPAGTTPADQRPSLDPSRVPAPGSSTRSSSMIEIRPSETPAASSDHAATRPVLPPAPPTKIMAPRATNLQLRPIPDPDAPSKAPISRDAPLLLNPGDRTARANLVRPGTYTAIAWPVSHGVVRARPATVRTMIRPATPQSPLWDDSGWRSIGH